MNFSLGRYVYGIAAIASGVCTLVWHDFANVQMAAHDAHRHLIISYFVGAIEVLGGVAVLWPVTLRCGAIALGVLYGVFALFGLPGIFAHPLVYNGYGNVFEQLSFVAGALIVYASAGSVRMEGPARVGYYLFGVCVVSFTLEQAFYLAPTASFVPAWIPLGPMFWAIATTIAFAVAAIALLTGVQALLASRLTTVMIAAFGFLVWVPAIFADAHSFGNWSECMETLGITGTAWIVAEYLAARLQGRGRFAS
jgi:uncharacterized membrane protein YphA (DoxX/SURF4 family)